MIFVDLDEPNEGIAEQHIDMFESRISAAQPKHYQDGTNVTQKQQHGPTTWRDTPKNP